MENHTHFLKLLDFTPAEIQQFLDTAADLKAKKKAGIPHKYLEGKNVALIFEKTSTRTRCAFEVAAQDLGMGSTYLGPTGSQIGVKESIADTARVLGATGIETVEAVSALTAQLHPAAVIVIDALAARRMGRVCTTIQLSDSGLVPGSGVGNHRHPLNQDTLGIPVLSIGVPTVVDAATVAADLLEQSGVADIDPERLRQGDSMFVTPKDIDAQVRDLAKVVGYAIDWAVQDLEIEEITALLS